MSNLTNVSKKMFLSAIFLAVLAVSGFVVSFGTAKTASADCLITSTLRVGSIGPDVVCLQSKVGAVADGKFGPMTKSRVMAWQASNGLVADGIVGPMTRSLINAINVVPGTPVVSLPAGCSSVSGYSFLTGMPCSGGSSNMPADCLPGYLFSPTTGARCDAMGSGDSTSGSGSVNLGGGAGSIDDADFISGLSGEEVGEKAKNVKIAGLNIEADSGSDINLRAVRLNFSQGTADEDFEDYADEVSILFKGKEVARVDADEFNDDNNFTKTISISKEAVIEKGKRAELVVAVSAVRNIDSNDIGETWNVEFNAIRYEDASGAIMTDNSTGDIGGATRSFSFESFASASDANLKIAKQTGSSADAINDARMINVHTTQRTRGVQLLAFTLEADGDSDLEIRKLGVDFEVTGANNVDDVIAGGSSPSIQLVIDGKNYGRASYYEDGDGVSVGQDEEVLFNNVDYVLKAGDKVDAFIEIDLLPLSGNLDEGDTIFAQITETQTDKTALFDIRDESGERLGDVDITGTAVAEANQMFDQVFTLKSNGWTLVNLASSSTAGIDESATFRISLDITAVDGSVFIDDAPCNEDNDALDEAGILFSVINSTDFSTQCSVTTNASDSTSGDAFEVKEGETKRFDLTVVVTASSGSNFAQVVLEGIGWSEADEAGDRIYSGNLSDKYQSSAVFINNR